MAEAAAVPNARIPELFSRQRANRAAVKRSTASQRVAKLERLRDAILAREQQICAALYADFRKAATEVEISEILPCLVEPVMRSSTSTSGCVPRAWQRR